jgi:endonuclease/exonuclease/phosphatase (EEP) superfamily protein YafD
LFGVDHKLPLDRFFFSGFETTAARVLDYKSSDHLPMLVRLKLTSS